MFVRFLEMTTQPGKKPELIRAIEDEIIPIFKTYKGFVEVIHLEVETDPAKMYGITLWRDRTDLERYTKENFPKVHNILEPYLTVPIIVRHCTINEATTLKFASAIAA
jgi:heme-degrading monooxygenase HmoA